MSRVARWLRPTLILLVLAALPGLVPAQEGIPPALAGWKEWVLTGHEYLRCPFFFEGGFGEPAQHVCAWPQRLRLEAATTGGRFSVAWIAYAQEWLPLPGDPEHWPLDVRLDGAATPVVAHGGGPAVRVNPGQHLLTGELAWEQRPESLRVPDSIALVDLTLDGQPVFPLQRAGASLWLGRAEAAAGQADALSVQVYRKLTDGLPPFLETRIRLDVSGQGREALLGPVLPAGFVPTAVTSDLPALLEGDGRLRVHLRPGNWQVVVSARGLEPLAQLGFAPPGGAWPADEIWSYEARPDLRVTSASGGRPVDPSQVDVPAEWVQLPAFAMEGGSGLVVEERSRGMADDANRLTLRRQLWLDFSGPGLNARDTLTGRMVRDFRLDLAEPFVLRRAEADGEPLLVTRGAEPGLTGVELRNPEVNLNASSRVERVAGPIPVTGWRSGFEGVAATLHLPPGRQLVAALGADSSPQAWVDRWSLLDVFLLLITTMLAFRLLGPTGGGVAFVFLGLSYHESVGPLWSLLLVLILCLLHRALPSGRLATVVAGLRGGALLAFVLVALPFVARELRLALYPQLEAPAVGAWGSVAGLVDEQTALGQLNLPGAPMEEAEAPQVQQMAQLDEKRADLASGLVSRRGGKDKAAQRLQRYAASNVFQAGGGEPAWVWRQASLSWSGPVLPDQTLRLVVTPPWLTRALRVLMVGLLALLLARLVGALRGGLRLPESPVPVAGLLLLALLGTTTSGLAQQTPDPALLDQLRQRMLKAPECVPGCGQVEDALVEVGRNRLAVSLTVHAAALVAVPLPSSEAAWRITELTVDGASRDELLRQGGALWIPLSRGVHRVEARGTLAAVDSLDLRFPTAPAHVRLRGAGWDWSGVRNGRLLTDTLGLVRVRREGEAPGLEGAAARVPPFVRVERDLDLDLDWTATTRVGRVAPKEGSVTVEVPLLPGESVLTPGFEVRDGQVTVALGAGVGGATWQSRLERVDRLELTFDNLGQRAETWRVTVSPQWSAHFAGVPPTTPAAVEDYWVHEFHPLPGEKLAVEVGRPEGVAGATLAVDQARLSSNVGRRASEHTLALSLRSTRGGQHTLTLPAEAEVLGVTLDSSTLNLRPEQGRLTVPVHPGEQRVEVRWRDSHGASLSYRAPAVDLGTSASNLSLDLNLPANRWVLAASGPRVGPAVLYWGEILVMGLLAFLLARLGRSPLRLHHWLLLGLGFSTFSWVALALVVIWLLALDWRGRLDTDLPWWRFDLVQLGLTGLTLVALSCLLTAVPFGLLGRPDMHVVGNGSSAYALHWFQDQTGGPLPQVGVLSLPLFLYRAAMLAWALWLAVAILAWLRWGWGSMTEGGGWRRPPSRSRAQPPAVDEPLAKAPRSDTLPG